MIEPKDLRLGNWVHFPVLPESKIAMQVASIAENKILLHVKDCYENISAYPTALEPISLNPDVLEKIKGIKKLIQYMGDFAWEIDSALTLFKETPTHTYYTALAGICVSCDKRATIAEVDSLHTLQNLYFALTGEELTYEP